MQHGSPLLLCCCILGSSRQEAADKKSNYRHRLSIIAASGTKSHGSGGKETNRGREGNNDNGNEQPAETRNQTEQQTMTGTMITPIVSAKTAIMFDGLFDTDDEEQEDEPGNNTDNKFHDMAIEEIA
jgi:hypothetical protein